MAGFTMTVDGDNVIRTLTLCDRKFQHITYPPESLQPNTDSFLVQIMEVFPTADDSILNTVYILDYTTNSETIQGLVRYLTEWEDMYDRG